MIVRQGWKVTERRHLNIAEALSERLRRRKIESACDMESACAASAVPAGHVNAVEPDSCKSHHAVASHHLPLPRAQIGCAQHICEAMQIWPVFNSSPGVGARVGGLAGLPSNMAFTDAASAASARQPTSLAGHTLLVHGVHRGRQQRALLG